MNNSATDDGREQSGFSAESLDMLKSEEGQLNAVFACFGSAAQHAQIFEEALSRFLITYNKIADEQISPQDLEAIGEKLSKRTMGQLLRELAKFVTFPDDSIDATLEHALSRRNFLMHEFFLARRNDFGTESGRMELLRELTKDEMVLDRCRVMLNAMRIALCRTVGIKDEYEGN